MIYFHMTELDTSQCLYNSFKCVLWRKFSFSSKKPELYQEAKQCHNTINAIPSNNSLNYHKGPSLTKLDYILLTELKTY